MTLKSLLLAATLAGGIALGASAANAQTLEYSVTDSTAFDGTFEFNNTIAGYSTAENIFYSTFDGTGAYAGVTGVSFSTLAGAGYPELDLFYGSNNVNYVITSPTLNSSDTAYTGSIVNAAGGAYTISAAPEPSMWALMIAGVAMVGSLLRVSRKQGALSVA
jgi:hypothetical protein